MVDAIRLTVQAATLATILNLPIAIGLGWLIVKRRVRGAFLLDILASLPLAVPPVVVGYMLLLILGRNGPVGGALDRALGIEIVFTWVAASLAAAIVSFPLIARAVMVALSGVDERLERSARSLGAGPIRTAVTITLPIALPGILAGVLLGFIRALSEFGATIVVAGNIPGRTQTLPLAIYHNVQLGRDQEALILVAVSVLLAIATLAVHNWLVSRTSTTES